MDTSYLISDDLLDSKSSNDDEINKIGTKVTLELLELRNQVKIAHWQTKIYAEHKALDKLFDLLNRQNDRWVETFMGKYNRIHLDMTTNKIHLKNLDDFGDGIVAYLKDWVNRLIKVRDQNFSDSNNSDLSNIFDEIFGEIHRTCYLLSLN